MMLSPFWAVAENTAPFAYWRIHAGTTFFALAEIEMSLTPAGADQTTEGQAIASGYTPNLEPFRAFNDDFLGGVAGGAHPCFASQGGGTEQWIGQHFASAKAIQEVRMWPRSDSFYTQAPAAFTIEYSSDGSSWTVSKTYSGITWAQGVSQTFAAV